MGKPGKTVMPHFLKGGAMRYMDDKGAMMDHGAKQIGNPGLHKKYGMHQESAAEERKNLLTDMPVDDKAAAMQMKTGIYQDRMDGKLPQMKALKQYGMDKEAVKMVGKKPVMQQEIKTATRPDGSKFQVTVEGDSVYRKGQRVMSIDEAKKQGITLS